MSDREAKQKLKQKVDRFLYGKVEWETDAAESITALQSIIDDLIVLKFEGGKDHVEVFTVDAQKMSYLMQAVPLPKEGVDNSREYQQALLSVSMWLQNLSLMMTSPEWYADYKTSEIDCNSLDQ